MQSKTWQIMVSGPHALFTRADLRGERVSYDVGTPPALAGMLETILWRPGFNWQVSKIRVLKPIRWTNLTRNEVKKVTIGLGFVDLDTQHTQRRSRILVDVAYLIDACIIAKEGVPLPELRKMEAMGERYLKKGKRDHIPFLGCSEFPARCSLYDGPPVTPIPLTVDLGRMPHSYRWENGIRKEVFMFDAKLINGVLDVPEVL